MNAHRIMALVMICGVLFAVIPLIGNAQHPQQQAPDPRLLQEIEHLTKTLLIEVTALGPEHRNVAITLFRLASLYQDTGSQPLALSLYERSLAIFDKNPDVDVVNLSVVLNNLAILHQDMGNFAQALPLHQRTLTLSENAFGPEHPRVGSSLKNLGLLYRAMGDHVRALSFLNRSLEIFEKGLGPDHAHTISTLESLADLRRVMGN